MGQSPSGTRTLKCHWPRTLLRIAVDISVGHHSQALQARYHRQGEKESEREREAETELENNAHTF